MGQAGVARKVLAKDLKLPEVWGATSVTKLALRRSVVRRARGEHRRSQRVRGVSKPNCLKARGKQACFHVGVKRQAGSSNLRSHKRGHEFTGTAARHRYRFLAAPPKTRGSLRKGFEVEILESRHRFPTSTPATRGSAKPTAVKSAEAYA